MIQQYLEAAGLHIELHEMEWGALKNVTNAGRYDMALFNWFGDYPDAENFLRPLFHSANKRLRRQPFLLREPSVRRADGKSCLDG